jgi:hypothetical protein
MPSEHHNWTVPAPLRALLWWPPVAFVVAMVNPSAAAGTIAAAGAVLAVLGVVVSTVGRAVARRLADQEVEPAEPVATPLAMAAADAGVPMPAEQRAA